MTLREEIAKELCLLEGWKWNSLKEVRTNMMDHETKSDYLRRADALLPLFRKEIEGEGNPYPVTIRYNDPRYQDRALRDGAEGFRQALLERLESTTREGGTR